MKVWAIVSIVYAAAVIVLAITKPAAIWNMKKIQMFEKVLGVKGTEIFFYVWALIFLVLGVWLFTR
ncbi:conserved protein of unknown function [Petrocella atlantisensis]|uniref:Uncharacterized protein n=1 Tax=Petrocella atlantisensis TaxID=2173034 RepID=A0A3P7RZ09_9FIRM|nr:hypothetical protein [Petrocella atlantisensis]VDN47916.1 conserved protein of unknown function [Petrocella atlantisensis]